MNEKIKWFGRYLGCPSVHIYSDNVPDPKSRLKILSCHGYNISNRKLVLKELKDISVIDARICVKKTKLLAEDIHIHTRSNFGFSYSFIHGSTNIKRTSQISLIGMNISVSSLDFLRSKGYAIGIPKEFYITESELKEE